jgi:8-oxo-dGTP pyrophosphatase MutT (NUDIX family)
MTHVLYGPRLGKEGKLRLGCSAAIFDEHRRILLTRRADNGQWCLPGGAMESGETAAEACEREVLEETGLSVRVKRLVGVYSHSDQLVVYPDGGKFQIVALHFEAEVVGGELGLSDETTDFGFFTLQEAQGMEMIGRHKERVIDTFENYPKTLIK